MQPLIKGFRYAACCALAFTLAGDAFAQTAAQSSSRAPQAVTSQPDQPSAKLAEPVAVSQLPDSPGTEWAKAQDPSQQSSSSSSASTQTQTTNDQDQNRNIQRPLGTAAAEAPKVKGVTAAQPSGVAIAPAKQRRVRTIVIRVGAIMAAGAAVGAVVALAEATPSRPPGAH